MPKAKQRNHNEWFRPVARGGRKTCPECRKRGRGGHASIGGDRSKCTTCNTFMANVLRITSKRLRAGHEAEYQKLKLQVILDLYPQIIERFIREEGLER